MKKKKRIKIGIVMMCIIVLMEQWSITGLANTYEEEENKKEVPEILIEEHENFHINVPTDTLQEMKREETVVGNVDKEKQDIEEKDERKELKVISGMEEKKETKDLIKTEDWGDTQVSFTDQVSMRVPRGLIEFDVTLDGTLFDQGGTDFYDLPTYLKVRYSGNLPSPSELGVYFYEANFMKEMCYIEYENIAGGTIDIESLNLPNGQYTVMFVQHSSKYPSLSDSAVILMEILNIDHKIDVDQYYNPHVIEMEYEGATDHIWNIYNENGEIVGTGIGSTVSEDILLGLPEGKYKVVSDANATTMYGSVVESKVTEPFEIRHPDCSIQTDREFNPESITATGKIPDSTLHWEIKNEEGIILEQGMGGEIPTDILKGLEEGHYTVEYTEISPENESSKTTEDFIVRYPESQITIDKPINPDKITGEPKIPESSMDWVIKDNEGKEVASGSGKEIPKDIIEALEDGEYTVEYTEISPEDLIDTTKGKFTIHSKLPDPTPKPTPRPEPRPELIPNPRPNLVESPKNPTKKQPRTSNWKTKSSNREDNNLKVIPKTGDVNDFVIFTLMMGLSFLSFLTTFTKKKQK